MGFYWHLTKERLSILALQVPFRLPTLVALVLPQQLSSTVYRSPLRTMLTSLFGTLVGPESIPLRSSEKRSVETLAGGGLTLLGMASEVLYLRYILSAPAVRIPAAVQAVRARVHVQTQIAVPVIRLQIAIQTLAVALVRIAAPAQALSQIAALVIQAAALRVHARARLLAVVPAAIASQIVQAA